ncbi:MAG: hypothetical protein DME61_09920 [Verrucomicrobia bacterium]|nr:MAG: hypothetical protein DME61_09920 [Verrucomicrobiota bacterium]
MPSPLTISDFKLGWYRSESAVAVLADLNHGLSAKCTDKKDCPTGQKAWARTNMDYGGNRRISYDFSPVLL